MAIPDNSSINFNALFTDPESQQHFSHLDYALRSGVYLQSEHPRQRQTFQYLEDNLETITAFYRILFGLKLSSRTYLTQRYYFLSPTEETAARLPDSFKHELKPAHVLIGLLLCQITMVDREEATTVEDIMRSLINDVSPYREGVFHHLANLKKGKALDTIYNIEQLRRWITSAIEEFASLGWIYISPEGIFQVMPALDHLRQMYRDDILKMETRFTAPALPSTELL